MINKLYTITATKGEKTLKLHFVNDNEMYKAVFELKRDGFTVSGEYDHPIAIHRKASEALETARIFAS